MSYKIHGTWSHSKAAEEHIDVTFQYEGMDPWRLSFPIKCRRAGIDLQTEEEIKDYVSRMYSELHPDNWAAWREYSEKYWENSISDVTKPIFERMASEFKWFVYSELSNSSNPAKRLQDIKDFGFTIGTRKRAGSKALEFMLLPKLPVGQSGYEYWSGKLRARIVKLLKSYDAYEGKAGNPKHLLPDHKFPEVRWDRDTKRDSLEDLTDSEIMADFQLVSNQRNQQKREVCRGCFQTGVRGSPFGLKYYYEGTEKWPKDVPASGKAAEAGCVGCGWYDLEAWRTTLQRKLSAS